MAQFLFKRSGTADKRPDPAQMALGELDLNYDDITGGIFYKNSGGGVVKVGPAQVSATAPNSTPAGSSGNSVGEFWYNTGDNFLYIWDGSSWATTAPGVGMASPTVPGVVYGLTGDTDLNVALGKGAGSNITTGTCNVALGPNVAVASATGNCQLAIGYSATANWLTGDSTKAIKPGAGILDCADSTGSSGQLLSSTGANALEWITPNYISPTALNASSVGALIVNGCDLGGGTCFTAILPGPVTAGQILTNAYNPGDPGYLAGQGYLNWCTPDYISQSSFGPGALVVGCTPGSTGGICTVGSITNANNPGVAVGYYQGVTVTSALTGTGALANVNVIDVGYFPSVDSIEITQPGTGYALSETVRFTVCGNQITTCAAVASLNQSTICKAGYLSVGTNGQVLTADSTCALGVKWATTSGGSGIPCACITGQGALLTGTAANTPTALAVGTAGQVLTVDLTCSTGLKWATPSSASDATPLVAGVVFGRTLATGAGSTALGSGALRVGPVGACNVAVGLNAGCGVNNGACNTIVGALAGDALTDGCNNTVLGFQALSAAATICDATAIGSNAMCVATGAGNTAVGSSSMRLLTTGSQNTAVGTLSLCSNVTGTNNTAVGFSAGTLVTGNSNTLVGSLAGKSIVGGSANTGLGRNALCTLSSGGSNTALGNDVLLSVSTGQLNTAVGASSMGSATGSSNVAIGAFAGCLLTSGGSNVIIGCGVNVASPTGSCQLAIGFATGCNWLTGTSTLAIKPGAGILDCTDSTGTAGQVLMSNGANAICWGAAGGGSAATPTVAGTVLGVTNATNAGLGCNVLASNTGTNNTALGLNAGCSITTGSCNLALGNNVQVATATGDCQLAIGFSATDNWLTGDSTKAIQPGAGILDCAGSGGGAGQALFSNGANAICWGNTLDLNLFCCQNAASCGANGGNLIVGSYADGNITPAALNPGTAGQILTISPTCNVNPVRWCTANYLCGACYSKGAIAVGCNQVGGGVGTLTCVAPNNPGVAVGYYPDVPINGGSGTGLTANINIINAGYFPFVDSVEVSNPGTGYLGSNSGMTATINGTTLSTTFSVVSLNTNTLFNYSYLAVGTNGQVLTADSACTNGVKWAATGSASNCNTLVGLGAGTALTSGANNVLIGCCAGTTTGGVSGALTTESNRIVMGNSAHTCAQIQIAWTTTSDIRDKALDPAGVPYGLLFVEQLEPIAYRWCDRCSNEVTDEKLRYGFSAQNVRSLEGDEPVIVSDDNPDKLMITDQHLLPVLVNAIKELSEKNKLLEERIAILEDKA